MRLAERTWILGILDQPFNHFSTTFYRFRSFSSAHYCFSTLHISPDIVSFAVVAYTERGIRPNYSNRFGVFFSADLLFIHMKQKKKKHKNRADSHCNEAFVVPHFLAPFRIETKQIQYTMFKRPVCQSNIKWLMYSILCGCLRSTLLFDICWCFGFSSVVILPITSDPERSPLNHQHSKPKSPTSP